MTREKQKLSTLLDKIWNKYLVCQDPPTPVVLYFDLHLIHEVTSQAAFEVLQHQSLVVHRPGRTFATTDHKVSTVNQHLPDSVSAKQIQLLGKNCEDFGIPFFGLGYSYQGVSNRI